MIRTAAQPSRALLLGDDEVRVLMGYLDTEASAQRELLELLKRKEATLVAQDLEGLKACLSDATPIMNRLEETTRQRVRTLTALARRLNLSQDEMNISGIADRCPFTLRPDLEDARDRLKDVVLEIGKRNRRIQVLIRNGIELNRALVHTLFGCQDGQVTYDKTGAAANSPPVRTCLDREL